MAKGKLPPAFLKKGKGKAAPREGSAAEERMDRMQGVPGAKKPNPFAKGGGKPFSKGGKT